MDPPSSFIFENIPTHRSITFVLKQNILFSKARLSIIKIFFIKGYQGRVINFPRKEMHQRFSTQLLSPNASYKVIKILKQQGGGKCTGACLNNTRLVLLGGDHILCWNSFRLSILRFVHQHHLVVDSVLVLRITWLIHVPE
jgi:hypothetical protein